MKKGAISYFISINHFLPFVNNAYVPDEVALDILKSNLKRDKLKYYALLFISSNRMSPQGV